MKKTILLLSCEHASHYLPPSYKTRANHFPHQNAAHAFEACDPYSAILTQAISKSLKCDFLLGEISRYVLDLNKKHGLTQWALEHLTEAEKKELLEVHLDNYRKKFMSLINDYLDSNTQILHLSIHTFNPQEKGIEHNAAIGILYDPSRHGEKEVARIWNELLIKRTPYRVRLNYPRSGKVDNFTSYLRKQYAENDYLGLELECNATLLAKTGLDQNFTEEICHSIYSLIELL